MLGRSEILIARVRCTDGLSNLTGEALKTHTAETKLSSSPRLRALGVDVKRNRHYITKVRATLFAKLFWISRPGLETSTKPEPTLSVLPKIELPEPSGHIPKHCSRPFCGCPQPPLNSAETVCMHHEHVQLLIQLQMLTRLEKGLNRKQRDCLAVLLCLLHTFIAAERARKCAASAH